MLSAQTCSGRALCQKKKKTSKNAEIKQLHFSWMWKKKEKVPAKWTDTWGEMTDCAVCVCVCSQRAAAHLCSSAPCSAASPRSPWAPALAPAPSSAPCAPAGPASPAPAHSLWQPSADPAWRHTGAQQQVRHWTKEHKMKWKKKAQCVKWAGVWS